MNTVTTAPKTAETGSKPSSIMMPDAPVLVCSGRRAIWLTPDGEFREPSHDRLRELVRMKMPIVCHAPSVAHRLEIETFAAYDVLELFAFVHPATFSLPTPGGLARALDLVEPVSLEEQCSALIACVRHLLLELATPGREEKSDPVSIAWMMGLGGAGPKAGGWPWSPAVLSALGKPDGPASVSEARQGPKIWHRLPEWSEHAPEPPPGHKDVSGKEARARLEELLQRRRSEPRPQQSDYTDGIVQAFAPGGMPEEPHVVLAEAGTGTGKTLGYLAPSTVWAEKNGGSVWISTYTRNLQRQVDEELSELYDDDVTKRRKVVVRKGRENYLCLLNLEDFVNSPSIANNGQNATAAGLMARWAAATRDGDMTGGDFPGWLGTLLGWGRSVGLSDRRGECIYSACSHYHKCFVEKSQRKSRRADIVIANHALVMIQTALAGDGDVLPSRYVFDEGHHLFNAADSAFAAHLTGTETADLRRWLMGAESNRRSRARGLKRRVEDMIENDDDMRAAFDAIMEAARSLPGPSWRQRLYDNKPKGVTETFLSYVRQQTYARNAREDYGYSIETEVNPPIDGLFEAAYALSLRLNDLKRPMLEMVRLLRKKLDDESGELDTDTRQRIESVCNGLNRRARAMVAGWIAMLDVFGKDTPAEFVDWFGVERIEGRDYDVGMYRHWVDPTVPFAAALKPHAHGLVITSASLRDSSGEEEDDWKVAEERTGAAQLGTQNAPVHRVKVSSPFNYPEQTRIVVVRDVNKNDPQQVAAAYRELFTAAGGGALGLFTSISRLKHAHARLVDPLEAAGLPLYTQHLDGIDVTTLIDMFRQEENACLLGTDATRDGMDVPGRSLRLIVYDRVPWPRPTIVHKARREAFGKGYDDMLTRFKLKQAYGRLVRTATDKGVFVMLDSMLPTRLTCAFPDGVEVQRTGLAEAVQVVREFVKDG